MNGKYMRGVYYSEFNKQRSQILVDIAEELQTTAGNVALAWVLRNPQVTSAIIGAKSLAQVEENVQAVELELTDEVVARLEAAFPVPRGPWLREGEFPSDLAEMQEQEPDMMTQAQIEAYLAQVGLPESQDAHELQPRASVCRRGALSARGI